MTDEQEEHETCGRCGYPQSEHLHVRVSPTGPAVLVCPTAIYLKDTTQELLNEP